MNAPVLLTDKSSRPRIGCKGPTAENWLAQQSITVPHAANRYSVDSRGVLAARLATSEFLFESMHHEASALTAVKRTLELAEMPTGVYPVLRQDFVIEISGHRAHDLFAQTCAVDLVPVERESSGTSGPVIMTSLIGVSVVLTCRTSGDGSCFTLWSDPSYSHYFWTQLLAIATELGGAADPASPIRSGGL
jgi:sarcosine oxidase gamma subunit